MTIAINVAFFTTHCLTTLTRYHGICAVDEFNLLDREKEYRIATMFDPTVREGEDMDRSG
jgi:hypothetical protein